ncbi:MAG: hypothetical protein M5U29_18520 [Anaerolineae bacterium]|nr:hypothetical protein [Anaerolineae bacterium]
MRNDNPYGPLFITQASVEWRKDANWAQMYANDARIVGAQPVLDRVFAQPAHGDSPGRQRLAR